MNNVQDRMQEAIRRSPARYTEIRIEIKESSEIHLRGAEINRMDRRLDTGGIVRCLSQNGGWGLATFNNIEELEKKVTTAVRCAEAVHTDKIQLGTIEPVVINNTANLKEDFRGMSLADKKTVLDEYNDLLTAGEEILSSVVYYADRFVCYHYANSEDVLIYDERPLIDLHIAAIAARDNDRQTGGDGGTYANCGFEAVRNRQEFAHKAVDNAQKLLDAQPAPGGKFEVVLDPMLAGVFVHEAFGHLSEADFVCDNPAAQEMMTPGRKFGGEILNIADSGREAALLPGSFTHDDEGVPMQRTQLVKAGVLTGRLHSRETAQKLGEQPTGNARATDYRYPPIVRMRNTFVERGSTSFQELLGGVKDGVYACGAVGGETYLGNFSFSATHGYRIRNGKTEEMLRDIVLSGNVFETLGDVTAVGDDFKWTTLGRCGKGQGGLPVAMGAPSLRIENVVMGGQ